MKDTINTEKVKTFYIEPSNELYTLLCPVNRNWAKIGDYAKLKNGKIIEVRSLCYRHLYCKPYGMIAKKDIDTLMTLNRA